MNAVVQYDPSVPAFLRNSNFLALAAKAQAGLSTGAPPRLSFRGSRFKFVAGDGTETPLPAEGPVGNNSITLDVIVLDASDHVSKFYYDKKYDPNADDLSPACFSDNGVGPSVRAAKPQSLLCGNCPNNAWGSKVSETGSQIKACSDVKKLAIIPVSNVDGPAFMIGVPAASLKTWASAVGAVSQRGIPIPALVFRLGFDASVAFPKLTFSPVRYITESEAGAVQDLFGSDECSELVGRKDMAISAMPGVSGNTGGAAGTYIAGGGGATAAPPIHVVTPPSPFTAPAPEAAPAFLNAAPAPQAPAEGQRRRRRTAAEMAAARAPEAAQPNQGQAATPPMFNAPQPPNAGSAAAGAPDLNALLDKVMGGK